MTLLDAVFDSLPPSKNRRTAIDKRTAHLYTTSEAREWMGQVKVETALAKKHAWTDGTEVQMFVYFYVKQGVHTFDIDGAMPCLVDAVFAGLAPQRKNPPDGWVMRMIVIKTLADRDATRVVVETA